MSSWTGPLLDVPREVLARVVLPFWTTLGPRQTRESFDDCDVG